MTKNYELRGIDCAVCAKNIEEALRRIDGLSVRLSFVTEKLTLSASDEVFAAKETEAKKLIKKLEPGAKLIGSKRE